MGLRNPNRWLRQQPIGEEEGGELASDIRRKLRGYVVWELERDYRRVYNYKMITRLLNHYVGKSFDAFYSHLKKVVPEVRIKEMKYYSGVLTDDGLIHLRGCRFPHKPYKDIVFIDTNTMMIARILGCHSKNSPNYNFGFIEERKMKEKERLDWVIANADEFMKIKMMSNRKKKRCTKD